MKREETNFRDRLLNAQDVSPTLRSEYQMELQGLLHHRLTAKSRLMTWVGVVSAVAGAVLCGRATMRFPESWFVNGTFTVVCLMTAAWLGRVLWKGGFERRAAYAVVEGLGGLAASAFVAVTLLRGMHDPSAPASIFGGIMSILLVMIGFAWGTGNRIAAAKTELREHLLRVESRLADLAERVGKP